MNKMISIFGAAIMTVFSTPLLAKDLSLVVFPQEVVNEPFKMVALPYKLDALAPVISQQTMELHYGKHLQSYVNNVNKLIVGTKWANLPLETIVKKSSGSLFNNSGQLLNHNLYFLQFSPNPQSLIPIGDLGKMIQKQWGTFDRFKEEFEKMGLSLFGSGWVWLSLDKKNRLQISLHSGGDNPVTKGWTPLLGLDLWEHAYYLDYQNKRLDHIRSIWKIIDWSIVESRFSVSRW